MEYKINCLNITDHKSFHSEFKKVLGFPDNYGENMDSWIDCVDDLTDQLTLIQMKNCRFLKAKAPDLLQDVLECVALVNQRKLERKEKPKLIISIDS